VVEIVGEGKIVLSIVGEMSSSPAHVMVKMLVMYLWLDSSHEAGVVVDSVVKMNVPLERRAR